MHNREFTLERISKLKENEIAPLFANAVDVENIILPKEFVDCNGYQDGIRRRNS